MTTTADIDISAVTSERLQELGQRIEAELKRRAYAGDLDIIDNLAHLNEPATPWNSEPSHPILKLVRTLDLTPAEAVDYLATTKAGYSNKDWAAERGETTRWTVRQNTTTAREKLNQPAVIETVIVEVDDVIDALKWNARPEALKRRRTAVLRIHPPFRAVSEASVFYDERGSEYPPEMDPQPLHIAPRAFLAEQIPARSRAKERARIRAEYEDLTDAELAEYVDEVLDLWESEVRNALKQEVDLNDCHGRRHTDPNVVSIEYRSPE